MISLSVKAEDGEAEHYGKTMDQLQESIRISGNRISGTLKYVSDFSEFSGDPGEQSGNFLALSFESDDAETIETKVINGDHPNYVDCTDDMFCIYRIKDPATQKIEVKVTKEGSSESRTYDLSGLECQKLK